MPSPSPIIIKSKKSAKADARANEVVIYTYDSFISEWGPGPELEKIFEEKTGLELTFVDCGDGVQLLSRAILEKNNVQADVILGIDNNTSIEDLTKICDSKMKRESELEDLKAEIRQYKEDIRNEIQKEIQKGNIVLIKYEDFIKNQM